MGSLSIFINSLQRGEVVLPALKHYLMREQAQLESGAVHHKDIVIRDAEQTIACFKERKIEYNHREDLDGEYFHPSQLGKCMRAVFLSHFKAPEDEPATGTDLLRGAVVLEFGTYVHVIVQNLCERAGILVSREVAIVDKVNRHLGHADGKIKVGGEEYLLEIKTINARGYSALRAPHEAHKKQVHAYMRSLGLKWACILYFEKDGAKFKEFVVAYSEDYYRKEVAARIDKFFKHVRAKTLPDRETPSPNRFPCTFCAHRRLCYDEPALNKWLSTLHENKSKGKAVRVQKPKRHWVFDKL
jgi:hypothetical protein